jgi:hypothetical protein
VRFKWWYRNHAEANIDSNGRAEQKSYCITVLIGGCNEQWWFGLDGLIWPVFSQSYRHVSRSTENLTQWLDDFDLHRGFAALHVLDKWCTGGLLQNRMHRLLAVVDGWGKASPFDALSWLTPNGWFDAHDRAGQTLPTRSVDNQLHEHATQQSYATVSANMVQRGPINALLILLP